VVKVGLIGAGAMGATHARTLETAVRGAELVAVSDIDTARAAAVAGTGRIHNDAQALIADPDVDAVLIASSAETHEEHVLACLEAGKPVLCEKPLATTVEGCRRIVEAEAARDRRLVQVGFMRRYDHGYLELKRLLDGGAIGTPLLVHCAHRNADIPLPFTTEQAITDSVVHEVDIVRWLLEQEITAVSVLAGRASRHAPDGVRDPQVVLLETSGGVLVDVESFLRAQYGYDIRCEVVGEEGTLELPAPAAPPIRSDGRHSRAVAPGFEVRFAQAYRDELQAWVDGMRLGRATGPTAWDGYVAGAVTEACLRALDSGERLAVRLARRA